MKAWEWLQNDPSWKGKWGSATAYLHARACMNFLAKSDIDWADGRDGIFAHMNMITDFGDKRLENDTVIHNIWQGTVIMKSVTESLPLDELKVNCSL